MGLVIVDEGIGGGEVEGVPVSVKSASSSKSSVMGPGWGASSSWSLTSSSWTIVAGGGFWWVGRDGGGKGEVDVGTGSQVVDCHDFFMRWSWC